MKQLVKLWARQHKSGTCIYHLRWVGHDGKRQMCSLGHGDKRRVEIQRREKEMELRETVPFQKTMILNELLDDYLERTRTQIESSTANLAKIYFKSFIGVIGNKNIADITYGDCEKYQQYCIDSGLKPATANSRKAMVSRVFSLTVKRGQLDKNPFIGLRKMKVPKNKIRIYSNDEFERILNATSSKIWKARLLLAKTAGLRRGEILNLTVDDIDFERDLLTVQPKEETAYTWRWQVKDKDRRELPLIPALTKLLAEIQLELPDGQPYLLIGTDRFQWMQSLMKSGKLKDELRRCPENNFERQWRGIKKRAGIKSGEFHDFRRTCITEWAEGGLHPHEVNDLGRALRCENDDDLLHRSQSFVYG